MKILSFGEILWDVFPKEKKIGGAPFNFAAHAAVLGAESYLVSAVGADENGTSAIEAAKDFGINTKYIYVSRKYPTGVCTVTLQNGLPSYKLESNTAYDHIPDTLPNESFDAIYMGTLAMRNAESRRTFEKILRYTHAKEVLFDVNFRGDFYSRELVESFLRHTTILKVSGEELPFFGNKGRLQTAMELSKKYPKLKHICITLGEEGALVYHCKAKALFCADAPKVEVISTVGAGDSFAACFLVNYLKKQRIGQCLDRAVALSSYVVTQLEAVPSYDGAEFFKKQC